MLGLRQLRAVLATGLAAVVACPPAQALVALNDGRDRIFVTATVTVTDDSNIFANSDNEGDTVIGSSLVAEYTRRAGWIGVNGSMAVSASHFGDNRDQNFSNPSYSLEFTKQSGRTTGSIIFNGARESRADAAVNMRSTAWNYSSALNFKYPAGLNTFTGHVGYSSQRYVDNTIFADLATFTSSLDLIHILPAERELIAGYRHRYSETSHNTSSIDHSVTLGLSGKLIRGVVGNIRAGWQTRIPRGTAGLGAFSSWTLSGTASYALGKRINLAAQASKDFSTTATDSSVDVTTATLETSYVLNARMSLSFAGGWGHTKFLGESGRIVLSVDPLMLGPNRQDTHVNWSTGLNYNLGEHLKLSLNYSWFRNWSTTSYADFIRQAWGLSASSRW